MPHRIKNSCHTFLVAAVFALFFFLSFYRLNFLFPDLDEIWISIEALRFLYRPDAQTLTMPAFFCEHIKVPSMICFYSGTLNSFMQIPFLYFFTPSYISMRLSFIILSALGLLSLYYCLKTWLGKWTALAVIALTVMNTMYIRTVRQGSEHDELLILNLFWISLALFILKLKTDKNRYLAGAGFIWGIAVWAKLHMPVYIVCAACAYYLGGFHKNTKQLFKKWTDILLFGISFIIGAFPFINAYFVLDPEKFIIQHKKTSLTLITDIFNKLAVRFGHFWLFLKETNSNEWPASPNIGFPFLSLLTITFVLVYLFVPKSFSSKRTKLLILSLLTLYAAVFACLLFTPSAMTYSHITAMLFLPELTAGLFIWISLNTKHRLSVLLAILFLTALTHTTVQRYTLMKDYYVNLKPCPEQQQWHEETLEIIRYNPKAYLSSSAYARELTFRFHGLGLSRNKDKHFNIRPDAPEKIENPFYLLTAAWPINWLDERKTVIFQETRGSLHYTFLKMQDITDEERDRFGHIIDADFNE